MRDLNPSTSGTPGDPAVAAPGVVAGGTPTPGAAPPQHAPGRGETTGGGATMRVVRNLDLVLLALALVVFLVAGIPIAGWLAATGAWLVQRVVRATLTRRAEASDDPRTTVGLMAGSMIGRGWLVAGVILAVGLANSKAGLAAAVLLLAVFTIQFTTGMVMRPLEREERRR